MIGASMESHITSLRNLRNSIFTLILQLKENNVTAAQATSSAMLTSLTSVNSDIQAATNFQGGTSPLN